MKLLTFDLFEKVQPDFFKKNPKFYLSQSVKELKKRKKDDTEKEISNQEYINKLKQTKIEDIKFSFNEQWKQYNIISPNFLTSTSISDFGKSFSCRSKRPNEYDYKIILAFVKSINRKEITLSNVDKNTINPLFKELSGYYGLYYKDAGNYLYLTTDEKKYKNKISEIKKSEYEDTKIIYYNNNTKGKEFTDIELIEVNKLKNILKNITVDDISFTKDDWSDSEYESLFDRVSYSVKFKDKELTDKIYKYKLIQTNFFTREDDSNKIYFGHLKNRYHTGSIETEIQGIGLGYKIYKAFLKFNGYMVSDEQSSLLARKIYYNLLKDDDVYYIVDKGKPEKYNKLTGFSIDDKNKVMLIWKDYPKMEQLLRIIRTHELRNKRKYEYDKALLPYIKNITKKTV